MIMVIIIISNNHGNDHGNDNSYASNCNSSDCVKSVQIRSYFWPVFSYFRTEYGDLLLKSPLSVRIQEDTDQ